MQQVQSSRDHGRGEAIVEGAQTAGAGGMILARACRAHVFINADLIATATGELGQLFPIEGDPREVHVARWRNSMPQYHVGHLKRVDRIERLAAQYEGLELAGSGYRGVGIPQCVHQGRRAAEQLIATLNADKLGG